MTVASKPSEHFFICYLAPLFLDQGPSSSRAIPILGSLDCIWTPERRDRPRSPESPVRNIRNESKTHGKTECVFADRAPILVSHSLRPSFVWEAKYSLPFGMKYRSQT